MVFFHLKKNEESVLLAEYPLETSTTEVIRSLIDLYNTKLRIERLCMAVEDLCNYGVYKPIQNHGYSEEELKEFSEEAGKCSEMNEKKKIFHEGREYLKNSDPTGRRVGLAPLEIYAETLRKMIADAQECISKINVSSKVLTTKPRLLDAIAGIEGAVMMAYPMGLPEFDPVLEILKETEDILDSIHSKDHLDIESTSLWWAGKELVPGKLLKDVVGNNNKTTIIVKFQKKGSGAPMREPPLDETSRRNLMAYYHKKQETDKNLLEDDDDSYLNSHWANPKSLKSVFQGIGSVNWKPR
ncbi:hypothetical protein HMI54_012888 [Coelomomyces lativittatus]|nr:hypothetical protein HMI54_012888 [Coelomomyces lativittatus]KAJ1515596.1 hypothetical protein HMI56_003308 [Coelomomyces lativittatus]KAJ1517113.1 hypothetical protein HMI55_000605 [Coelomomyces lativittatus]